MLKELRGGLRNAEIAAQLGISVNTVRYHVSNILEKLEQPNRAALRELQEVPRGQWRWLGAFGLAAGGRQGPGMGAVLVSIAVAIVAVGLLVVARDTTSLPSTIRDEPVSTPSQAEPPDQAAAGGLGSHTITPCAPGFGGDLFTDAPALAPSFGPMLVPRDLLELSAAVVPYCRWGFALSDGERDYDLAARFEFVFGEGDDREVEVWWVFYPEWDDPAGVQWVNELRKLSPDGTISYHDGYVVVVSPDVSGDVVRAAQATPDQNVWEAGPGRVP